jgi:hypothetical protein
MQDNGGKWFHVRGFNSFFQFFLLVFSVLLRTKPVVISVRVVVIVRPKSKQIATDELLLQTTDHNKGRERPAV